MPLWYGDHTAPCLTQCTEMLHDEHEPPPILGRWRNLNIVVLGWLALLIFLFYRFTQYFA
jgi:hypothetical protein